MSELRDNSDHPLGAPVPNWRPAQTPPRSAMSGRYCCVEPFDIDAHSAQLHAANAEDRSGESWAYLPYGPFETLHDFQIWADKTCHKDDPLFHTIIDTATNTAVGVASYLRIDPNNGSIEVGHIHYAPALQRTRAATEAMYLMMRRAFELGNRRYEWKCNALNAGSRAAAQRLGFSFEGVFRQAAVVKGRNRDTAWYAMVDSEWPTLQTAFERWLDPANFESDGAQRAALSVLTAPILVARG
jgi:RimJ/RimL family protein N-acetyltransferase